MADKEQILNALLAFARQRPGLDLSIYGDAALYRRESRTITRDLADARTLLHAVERRDITAQQIIDASQSAYSGRLTIVLDGDQARIDYCAGQYWPTEYRRAVCAVCAKALWNHTRSVCPSVGPMPQCVSPGDWLRAHFRAEFGRGIASRFFN